MGTIDPIQVARYKLDMTYPYLSDITFSLIPTIQKDHPSMSVDKKGRLYYDPDVLREKGWTIDNIVAVLFHEENHLIREHHGRVGSREPQRWNIAGDLEINDDLNNLQDLTPPDDLIYPSTFKLPEGRTAEEYYDLLEEHLVYYDVTPNNCGSSAHGDQTGEPQEGEGEGLSSEEIEILKDKVAEKIREKYDKNSLARGTIPVGLARWAEKRLTKKIDWRKVLATNIRAAISQKTGASDYTYRKPSRRHQDSNIIMPSTFQPVPNVAVVIDTSGSMSQREIGLAVEHTGHVLRALGCKEGVDVYSVDAQVHTAQRVFSKKQIVTKGGGGTDMRLGIERAMEAKPRPEVVIVITDGETPWPDNPTSAKVVAALTREWTMDRVPRWIKKVLVDDEED